jgi:hypothetical protein
LLAKHRKSLLTAIPKVIKRIMAAHVKNLAKWEKIAANATMLHQFPRIIISTKGH